MKTIWVGLMALAATFPGHAFETFTDSKAGDFALGQQLVTCAAFYDFVSGMSVDIGKPSAAEQFRNMANGWTRAGMLLLATGADRPNFDDEQTAQSIRDARLAALKAKYGVGSASALKDIQAEQKRDCDPLIPLQESIAEVLRQRLPPARKR